MKVEAGFMGGVYWVKLGNDTPMEFSDFMSAKIAIDNYVDNQFGVSKITVDRVEAELTEAHGILSNMG